jgi:UDPglucose 6-dehydrogenase
MKVSIIGTGYVGLVSGTCFAEMGHNVSCIDIDEEKVKQLKNAKSPIYEPGLNDLLSRNIDSSRLTFHLDYSPIKSSDVIFLAVGTPSGDDGNANLSYLKEAAAQVAQELSDDAIVVIKSTVPVGTHKIIKDIVQENTKKKFHIVSNPEFLREGSAIEDFMRPDRVVIGHADEEAAEKMKELYAQLVVQGNPILMMTNLSAELTKYAGNCLLATKISFINEIAKLADLTGANIEEVRKGIATDKRIGPHFLYPGPGYGGSCFPKDVKALIYTAKTYGMKLDLVTAAETVNERQKVYMFEKIQKYFNNDLSGKTFTFWGVAFKANTDDVRETSAIKMCEALVEAGATVNFFDPVASDNYACTMKEKLKDRYSKLVYFGNKYEALTNSDGLITMTEWREFRTPDFAEIKERLKSKVIFDARNLYSKKNVREFGLDYFSIGKDHEC